MFMTKGNQASKLLPAQGITEKLDSHSPAFKFIYNVIYLGLLFSGSHQATLWFSSALGIILPQKLDNIEDNIQRLA